jgi:DNA polymerase III subunit delta
MAENFLVIGDDGYIREKEIARIKDSFLSATESELNYSVHFPDDIDGMMNAVGTMPFLADKRVVLVRDAEKLSDEGAESLLKYLESPSDTGVMIVTAGAAFKKTAKFRNMSKHAKLIKADRPDTSTMGGWIRGFMKKAGVEISADAVALIVELKGTDTAGVKIELDKLASFAGGEKIEREHVESLVGRSVTETIFQLVDAINDRDGEWAFNVLNDLYDQKKQPPEIIGYLGWYIRVIQKIKLLTVRGMGPSGIASELGYSQGYVHRLSGQAARYSPGRVERWVSLLCETDRAIKTGLMPGQLAVETLLASLLNSK